MRIITGRFKGRQIQAPRGIRPTEDRIRKALFDIIDAKNADFLELFAGSGAVGFEALSRGAASVTFVENERACLRQIGENAGKLGVGTGEKAGDKAVIIPRPAEQVIPFLYKQGRKFDIIFLDPPYYKDVSEKILQLLGGYDILHNSGVVVLQHFRKDRLSAAAGELTACRQAKYGDSLLSFYRKSGQNVQKSDLPGDV